MGAYLRPHRLEEALTALARPHTVLAGGTDFYPARVGRAIDEDVLDIGAIAVLRGISADSAGWRLGATTTWSELIEADLPPLFDGLKQAAREVGGRQIQNAGTLAGNLCNASPAADGVPCLLALDAEIEIASPTGRRRLPLGQFITGVRRTALAPGELVVAIHVPRPRHEARSAFLKLGARRYLVISIAMAAATAGDRRRPCRLRPHRRRRLLAGGRAAAGARSGAGGRAARRTPCRAGRGRASRAARRRSTTCAAARPIAATPSSPCCAACWRASRHEGGLHPERPGRRRGTARRSRGWPRRCATISVSPAPRSAATPATAAPARCCSTDGRSAPAWSPMGQVEGRRDRDGRGPGRRRRRADGTAKILPRPWRRPMRHLHAGHADGGRGTVAPHRPSPAAPRSRTRWAACSAAAPATARSSRP